MRLLITRHLEGAVDGIPLDRWRVGFVCEVGTHIGCYLLAIGAAEPVDDDEDVALVPLTQQRFDDRSGPGASLFPRSRQRVRRHRDQSARAS